MNTSLLNATFPYAIGGTTEEPNRASDDIFEKLNYAQDLSAGLLSIVWLVIYIRSFRGHKEIYTSIVVVTAFYPLGYAVKYVIDFFLIVLGRDDDDIIALDAIQRLCFVVTSQSFYLSMLLKLYYSFAGSVYAVSKCMTCTLTIFLVTGVLLDVAFWVTRGIAEYAGTISEDITFHLNWIRSIFNVIFGVIFMACFVSKLLKLVMINSRSQRLDTIRGGETPTSSAGSPHDTSRASGIKKEAQNVARRHRRLLAIAVKFALLHGISITATNIQFSGWTLLNFELIKSEQGIFWFGVLWSWLWNIVLFVNYYTIWLSFPFAERQYRSVCGLCSECCLKGCSSLIATKIVDQANESPTLSAISMDGPSSI